MRFWGDPRCELNLGILFLIRLFATCKNRATLLLFARCQQCVFDLILCAADLPATYGALQMCF